MVLFFVVVAISLIFVFIELWFRADVSWVL